MNMVERVVTWVTVIGSIGGGALYLDDRHAKSVEVQQAMLKKANVEVVESLQKAIIADRINELEEKEFILSNKPELTDFEKFQLSKSKSRLHQLRAELNRL